MSDESNNISLRELLNITETQNLKIRFVKKHKLGGDPLYLFNNNREDLTGWLLWNYSRRQEFRVGQTVFGFVQLDETKWLLFDVVTITKSLDVQNGVGYECSTVNSYIKYIGRLVINYKNRSQNLVRNAETVIKDCSVAQILEGKFNQDLFPGYENVCISWQDLNRVINNNAWKTALENQKGVYLISDEDTGKLYVGSAYGQNMLYGRWRSYIRTGHGGNINLRNIPLSHIKNNFRYSILEAYKSTASDDLILEREYWWQETLCTKRHGYNLSSTV